MTIGPTQEKVVTMHWIVKVKGGFIMPMGYILAKGWAVKEYQPNAEVLKILENITGSVGRK
jgi:hypothetical protein